MDDIRKIITECRSCIKEKQERKFYTYTGDYKIGSEKGRTYNTTYAVSDKEAIRNVKIQILNMLGFPKYRINDLEIEEDLVIAPSDVVFDDIKVCPECGTRLTDGGYCPICDDGEEDY